MRSKKIMALLLTTAAIMGMTLTGCGNKINEDATFATLDDTTITMGVANFCAKYQQAMYDSFYMSYFGEDMWSKDVYGNGSTMTEDVKKDVADNLEEMYLLKACLLYTSKDRSGKDTGICCFISGKTEILCR